MTVHLDKLQNKKQLDGILSIINNVDNTTCVIIFASPQSITMKYPQLVCTIKALIRFVVVEELYLFNSFGKSFRDQFSLLQSKFFSKLRKHFTIIFLTATCMQCIQASLKKMTGMSITYYDWPSAAQLLTRRVTIYAHYSERPLLNMFKSIKKTLLESSPIPKK